MPVFISHTSKDNIIAYEIKKRLETKHGIECWIDDLDKELAQAKNTRHITNLILDRLEKSTHLLAVVTGKTQLSWWVPFEIGVARRAPRAISTITDLPISSLPAYLTDYPVLMGDTAYDEFAIIFKSQDIKSRRYLLEKTASVTDQEKLVDQFHSELKKRLRQ